MKSKYFKPTFVKHYLTDLVNFNTFLYFKNGKYIFFYVY